MNSSGGGRLPGELEGIVARLRSARAQADPLQLDQMKQRALARRGNNGRWNFMRSRLASLFTVAALIGGTGGAIAVAGQGSSHGENGGAAHGQYNNGKGCGDTHHPSDFHRRHDECKKDHDPSGKNGKGDSDSSKGNDSSAKASSSARSSAKGKH